MNFWTYVVNKKHQTEERPGWNPVVHRNTQKIRNFQNMWKKVDLQYIQLRIQAAYLDESPELLSLFSNKLRGTWT